jgi:hypothetical protein
MMKWRMNWKGLWVEAQGYDWWYYWDREGGHILPEWCVVCGSEWRPDKPRYIPIVGKVHIPCEGDLSWYWESEQIGKYSFRKLNEHVRYVCHRHGDLWPILVDCFTNTEVELSLPLSRTANYLLDIKYWTLTVFRFVKIVAGDFIAMGMYYFCRDYMKARKEGMRWPW